jgi:hypothetical protein
VECPVVICINNYVGWNMLMQYVSKSEICLMEYFRWNEWRFFYPTNKFTSQWQIIWVSLLIFLSYCYHSWTIWISNKLIKICVFILFVFKMESLGDIVIKIYIVVTVQTVFLATIYVLTVHLLNTELSTICVWKVS